MSPQVLKSKEKQDQSEAFPQWRMMIVAIGILVFAVIIIVRLFIMQVLEYDFYASAATQSHEVYKDLLPQRGSIYTRENDKLSPLVINKEYYLAYAEPVKIRDPVEMIDALSTILDLSEPEWKPLLGRLQKTNDPYEPIKHKVTKQQKEQLERLEFEGLGFISEEYRYYPEQGIGGHILGFVGFQDDQKKGQYGLEGYFDKELSGESGLLRSVKDALGSLITIGPRSIQKAKDGIDLVLTIDRNVQFNSCRKLKEFYDYYQAEKATLIIMESSTGAILAMCSFPDFDPETYNKVEDINFLNNPAIFYDYEPGSVFKTFTMSAGLDTGKITPETTYEDDGELKVGPYTLRNFDKKAYGVQTMTDALSQSLNLGAAYAAYETGKNNFRDYVHRFGFGEKTGIELDTEVAGNIKNLDLPGDVYYLTASYGHGITATPIQLIVAYGAIANNGLLVRPYIVKEKINSNGEVMETKPQSIRQVISQKTASTITGMLTQVVESSYDKKARVPNYYLAAKTGTALIPSPTGGYSSQTIHTIVGFGPVTNPAFVILVKMDKIKNGPYYASDSIGPLFSQLAQYLLNYYHIPPDY